jgi:hypothetical protein
MVAAAGRMRDDGDFSSLAALTPAARL